MSQQTPRIKMYPGLNDTIGQLLMNFDAISPERKRLLTQLSRYVEGRIRQRANAELVFICTHNSRRSHISQIWAQAAAEYYGIPNVRTYSGGTEATAFNPRAVEAVEKAGFRITKTSDHENAVYEVSFSDESKPLIIFSKRYDAPPNPGKNFAAIMTCSHADENCPLITGMEQRISLPYNDPKDFDGTPLEAQKYAERVREIGSEILYAFSQVNLQR